MTVTIDGMNNEKKTAFEAADDKNETGLIGDFFGKLKQNKKYWLLPMLIILLLFGVVIILGSTAAAPFIYTLF